MGEGWYEGRAPLGSWLLRREAWDRFLWKKCLDALEGIAGW